MKRKPAAHGLIRRPSPEEARLCLEKLNIELGGESHPTMKHLKRVASVPMPVLVELMKRNKLGMKRTVNIIVALAKEAEAVE